MWKKQQVMIKTSKRLIEFMLPRYTNMERAEGGKHRPGSQEKKIKTLTLGFKLRKMVKKECIPGKGGTADGKGLETRREGK